jgi:PilZ domain
MLRTSALADNRFLANQSIPCRRRYPRVEKPEGVWVYWNCKGRADTSRVRDLSTGGLFVETAEARDVDATIRLDFLVQEGQVRAKAVVRHVRSGSGLGLKFTELAVEDGPRLAALMSRLHSLSLSRTNSEMNAVGHFPGHCPLK